MRRPFLVTTAGRARHADAVRNLLGGRLAGAFTDARPHVPAELVPEAVAAARAAKADACLTLGGGSAVGLGKAIARETGLPLAAIPTTYAGSEMTSIWGTTVGREKQTGRDARVAPRLVLYDPELTYDLPADVSAASGMNAMAHAVEALYAPDASPISTPLAEDAIRYLARSLPRVVRAPRDPEPRAEALAGAHLAGRALELTTMGLHHRLCHVLGGLGMPHAETHAALLPYVVAFVAPSAPEAMARIAAALGSDDAAAGLQSLARTLGTRPLAALGLDTDAVPRAARLAAAHAGAGVTEAEVQGILERALAGDRQSDLRRASVADAPALADFAARLFAETFGPDNHPDDIAAHLAASFGATQQEREITDPSIVTLIAEHGGQLTAYAQVRRHDAPPCVGGPDPIEVWRFYVDRSWQGSGLAQRLMDGAHEAARVLGGGTLWLSVWERNPRARAFYARCGFRDVGTAEFRVGRDRQTDRILEMPVRPPSR
jgi:maleylacetate reductase